MRAVYMYSWPLIVFSYQRPGLRKLLSMHYNILRVKQNKKTISQKTNTRRTCQECFIFSFVPCTLTVSFQFMLERPQFPVHFILEPLMSPKVQPS